MILSSQELSDTHVTLKVVLVLASLYGDTSVNRQLVVYLGVWRDTCFPRFAKCGFV
jgi:hypothetical protein